jgi:hypothetical protein
MSTAESTAGAADPEPQSPPASRRASTVPVSASSALAPRAGGNNLAAYIHLCAARASLEHAQREAELAGWGGNIRNDIAAAPAHR